jgi:hypothetical protein
MLLHRFICNTSGSGKTRFLFEGLARHWGFYFAARTQPDGVGSKDVEELLVDLKKRRFLRDLPSDGPTRADTNAANRTAVDTQCSILLIARTYVFWYFLDYVSRSRSYQEAGVFTDEHKEIWLLLQAVPELALQSSFDIFHFISSEIRALALEPKDRESYLAAVKRSIRIDHGIDVHDLFCVIDEAQSPAEMYEDYFVSDKNQAISRPVLSEMVKSLSSHMPKLIVSGTGLSMQAVEEVLGSAVAKVSAPKVRRFTNLGAFDGSEDQLRYMTKYVPPLFFEGSHGILLERIAYWLHGR